MHQVYRKERSCGLEAYSRSRCCLLAGCAETSPSPEEQISQGVDFAEQQITWTSCEGSFECAQIAAPLDWTSESEDVISIALVRKAGTEDQLPMLVNPGGPGSSGVDYLVDGYDTIGTSYLRSTFQLIGFDPRGVGRTAPVSCEGDEAKDRMLYEHVPFEFGTAEYLDYSEQLYQEFRAELPARGLFFRLFQHSANRSRYGFDSRGSGSRAIELLGL